MQAPDHRLAQTFSGQPVEAYTNAVIGDATNSFVDLLSQGAVASGQQIIENTPLPVGDQAEAHAHDMTEMGQYTGSVGDEAETYLAPRPVFALEHDEPTVEDKQRVADDALFLGPTALSKPVVAKPSAPLDFSRVAAEAQRQRGSYSLQKTWDERDAIDQTDEYMAFWQGRGDRPEDQPPDTQYQ